MWLMLIIFFSHTALAQHDEPIEEKKEFSRRSKEVNFAIVYGAQWVFYVATQHKTIHNRGSFRNFVQNPFHPHFDKDHFSYNIIKHTLAGNYYYLFYRSRGYEIRRAFFWTFVSSLAFEFAVETFTEKPSLQDIYQTPVYGTLAGMTLEKVSDGLLSSPSPAFRFFGYVFNPFKLFSPAPTVVLTPILAPDIKGILLMAEF